MVLDNIEYSFCTADAAAIETMGAFGISENGISFESLMQEIGHTLPDEYLKGPTRNDAFNDLLKKGSALFPHVYSKIDELKD
ncbi:MAG: hypothetical protein R3F48_06330 [Candidatus Zixiibacteriota bacterium]